MSTLTENVEKVKSAHATISASIEAKGVSVPAGTKLTGMPALVDQIQTGGGFTEDTTTLSVAFGGVAKKITPKDVISFSSLTWQGMRHELGSKDYGVFDGNFLLDEAFWPAKPLPGYLYVECCNLAEYDKPTIELCDSSTDSILTSFIVSNSMAIKLPSDGFDVARFNSTRGTDNYDFSFVTYNHVQESILVQTDSAIGINPANNSLQSYTIIIKQKVYPKQHYLLFTMNGTGTLFYIDDYRYEISYPVVIPINYSFYANNSGYTARYKKFDNTLGDVNINSGQTYFLSDFDDADFISITQN